MGEYSDYKPSDWNEGLDDLDAPEVEGGGEFLHAFPAGYGPSVPPGYPHGYNDEPDMGYEPWTPRRDWARGAREHFDESDTTTLQFQYEGDGGGDPGAAAVYVPGYIGEGGSPYGRIGYMHRPRFHGDELEGEP